MCLKAAWVGLISHQGASKSNHNKQIRKYQGNRLQNSTHFGHMQEDITWSSPNHRSVKYKPYFMCIPVSTINLSTGMLATLARFSSVFRELHDIKSDRIRHRVSWGSLN
jgi:hypothetical protein